MIFAQGQNMPNASGENLPVQINSFTVIDFSLSHSDVADQVLF